MKVVSMYTGDDQKTHFRDIELTWKPTREQAGTAEMEAVTDTSWVRTAEATMPEFHPAPRRQYLVLLEGSIDLISTTGERRNLETGDIAVAEDTSGEGHIVRMHGCTRYTAFFAPIQA